MTMMFYTDIGTRELGVQCTWLDANILNVNMTQGPGVQFNMTPDRHCPEYA
jgi:hypothetical protein